MHDDFKLLAALGGTGVLIGLAKVLTAEEPLRARQVLGRAILSGGLGVAAGAAVIFIPGISFVAQVGLACIIASLGVSALEAIFARVVKK